MLVAVIAYLRTATRYPGFHLPRRPVGKHNWRWVNDNRNGKQSERRLISSGVSPAMEGAIMSDFTRIALLLTVRRVLRQESRALLENL